MRFISAVGYSLIRLNVQKKQAHKHQNNQFQQYFPKQLYYINLIYKVQKLVG